MRIAVVHRDRCHSKKCGTECILYCPRVRTGDETVVIGETGTAVVSEELCVGCGICIKKCPFAAIDIVSLPEELPHPTHRYGKNAFALYGLPIPVRGKVTGLLGANGIGKSTSVQILSGSLRPNMGEFDREVPWKEILSHYTGTELFEYLRMVSEGGVKTATKPQYIDYIPRIFQGTVGQLLKTTDERGELDRYVDTFSLSPLLDRPINSLSGGELQRVAICACLSREADFYFLDEITPFLDIYQRMAAATLIRELAAERPIMIVEHDLAILDFMCDNAHIMYGTEGAYGVTTFPRAVRHAINTYLSGYLKEENLKFGEKIEFVSHPPKQRQDLRVFVSYGRLTKDFEDFTLEIEPGIIREGEIIGIVGPNAIGKTTFVKMLAGVLKPTKGKIEYDLKISYKPQYISPDYQGSVRELFDTSAPQLFTSSLYQAEVFEPLHLKTLLDCQLDALSGGELQRVAIASAILRDADIYLLDEPSAYLDSEQRMIVSRMIRRIVEKSGKSALVVDHDVYFIDMVSDGLIVFEGTSGKHGVANGPYSLHEGMNRFLRDVDITFRRDEETQRPRVNKPDSYLERQQKESGEYYYKP